MNSIKFNLQALANIGNIAIMAGCAGFLVFLNGPNFSITHWPTEAVIGTVCAVGVVGLNALVNCIYVSHF